MNAAVGMQDDTATRRGLGFWILCLYLAFEYLRIQDLVPGMGGLKIPLVLTAILPLIWLRKSGGRLPPDSLVKWYLALLAVICSTVLFAVNHYWLKEITLYMLAYLLAVILPAAVLLNTKEKLATFFRVWVVIQTLLAVYAITHDGTGPGSFTADENDLALTMAMGIPYAYFLAQSPRVGRLMKFIWLGAALLMLVAVVISHSRGGFLGVAAVACALIYFSKHRLRNLFFVGLIALAGFFAASQDYKDEVRSIQDQQDSTRTERIYSWILGWEMFLDYPLGVGAGNYPYRVGEYDVVRTDYDHMRQRSLAGRAAHSLYFTLIPELGLLGIAVFTVICAGIVRRGREVMRLAEARAERSPLDVELGLMGRAMGVALVGFLVSGAFISVLYYPHLWFLLGFAIALRLAVRAPTAEASPHPVFGQVPVATEGVAPRQGVGLAGKPR